MSAHHVESKSETCSLRPEASKSGEGGIRTPDAGITDVTVFETAAFNRSATSPLPSLSTHPQPFNHPRTRLPLFILLPQVHSRAQFVQRFSGSSWADLTFSLREKNLQISGFSGEKRRGGDAGILPLLNLESQDESISGRPSGIALSGGSGRSGHRVSLACRGLVPVGGVVEIGVMLTSSGSLVPLRTPRNGPCGMGRA